MSSFTFFLLSALLEHRESECVRLQKIERKERDKGEHAPYRIYIAIGVVSRTYCQSQKHEFRKEQSENALTLSLIRGN